MGGYCAGYGLGIEPAGGFAGCLELPSGTALYSEAFGVGMSAVLSNGGLGERISPVRDSVGEAEGGVVVVGN